MMNPQNQSFVRDCFNMKLNCCKKRKHRTIMTSGDIQTTREGLLETQRLRVQQ